MEEKSNDWIKDELFKSLIDGEIKLNLNWDNVINCEETTTLVKECEKKCKKKGIPKITYNKNF